MQFLKLLSHSNSWNNLNKKLEELTKSGQAKFLVEIKSLFPTIIFL